MGIKNILESFDHLTTATDLRKQILAGADPNFKGKNEETALHRAAGWGNTEHLEIIETLIELGAHPNTQDIEGWTPLHWAVACGNDKACISLIELGADPSIKDKNGISVYELAKNIKKEKVIKALKYPIMKKRIENIQKNWGEIEL
jgi:uncharacterized protein